VAQAAWQGSRAGRFFSAQQIEGHRTTPFVKERGAAPFRRLAGRALGVVFKAEARDGARRGRREIDYCDHLGIVAEPAGVNPVRQFDQAFAGDLLPEQAGLVEAIPHVAVYLVNGAPDDRVVGVVQQQIPPGKIQERLLRAVGAQQARPGMQRIGAAGTPGSPGTIRDPSGYG
jgi:hypothetical protein